MNNGEIGQDRNEIEFGSGSEANLLEVADARLRKTAEAQVRGIGEKALMREVGDESVAVLLETRGGMPERAEGELGTGTERVLEMVAEENGYAQREMEPGLSMAGEESKLEVRERLADDREDLRIENGSGWEHDLLTKNQDKLTREAVARIDKVVAEKSYHPATLEAERLMGMHAILATYGRRLGDRN